MLTLVKMLHLLALVFGSLAALGGLYLGFAAGPHDLPSPGYTNTLRKFYRLTGLAALAVLWASGLVLLIGGYGLALPGFAFTAKIGFVILLTAISLYINLMAPGWARRGGPPAHLPALQWVSAASLILAVAFAVAAFG